MEFRSRRFYMALGFSALLHAGLLAAVLLAPWSKPPEAPPPPRLQVVMLELAAKGTPEATEEKPAPPPEVKPPEPQPPPQAKAPEPPPELPKIEAPPVSETPPAKQAELVPPAPPKKVHQKPKLEPPKPVPPPEVKAPEPQPEPQPPQPAQNEPPAALPPAPPQQSEAKATPRKGIDTGAAGGTSQEEMNRYITTLFTMIDAKKQYPPQSMQRREQGSVTLRLKIAADGQLIDASSPTEEPHRLVDASLEAVHRAAPFPPLPASLKKDQAEFDVPVVYKLQ